MAKLAGSIRKTGINLSRRLRRRPRAHIAGVVMVRSRTELPEILDPRRIYQVGDPGKWGVFECPCGRGHVLEVNLAHPGRARWRLHDAPAGPSLSPSVDFKGERRCHFWLRDGRVRWSESSEPADVSDPVRRNPTSNWVKWGTSCDASRNEAARAPTSCS